MLLEKDSHKLILYPEMLINMMMYTQHPIYKIYWKKENTYITIKEIQQLKSNYSLEQKGCKEII